MTCQIPVDLWLTWDLTSRRLGSFRAVDASHPTRAALAAGAVAPDQVRQARPCPLHQPPGFRRAFERALRRAAVPMAYSSGFSPHPRISYPNASPTGAATEAEYLEIGLAAACDPDKVRVALDAALPPGLDVSRWPWRGPERWRRS